MKSLPYPISFQWDEWNLDKNWLKHDISKEEAEEAFFDKYKLISKDKFHSQKEDRYILLGETKQERVLFVAFTIRDEYIRIISARELDDKRLHLYYNNRRKHEKTT